MLGQASFDELLAREAFGRLVETQVLMEAWRRHYNAYRPYSALAYETFAAFAEACSTEAVVLNTAHGTKNRGRS